jgi:site-specific DNA recombinase
MRVKVRCAIYIRKSTEEGLEQDFNSLDAQYEACAAYITSQKAEGWTLVANRYDDGGLSGGTLERPALKQLLADIASGQIDRIIVYKMQWKQASSPSPKASILQRRWDASHSTCC